MTAVRSKLLMLMLVSVVATTVIRGVSAAYCDENLFPEELEDEQQRRSSGVQFTKELSTTEYGPLGTFKTLHCCGGKYLSLEWFKDNRPYPWPGDVSSFILNPESANQTIYTRSLTSSDHGMYTCQLANQTNVIDHSIKLVTFDDTSYWGDPLPTYKMPKEQYAQIGDSVRLYCEAFVGKVNLPDAVNTITWNKISGNRMIETNEKYTIEEVVRENDQVLGAYLFINNIQKTDYGQFMCSVSNTGDQIVQQFTNITKPRHVFNNERRDKKVHRDLKLIVFVMLALILIVWKRRWFYLAYQMLKKKVENDKYVLPEKQVHTVIVFYDEDNRERAEKLMENMEHRDNFVTKKYQVDFVEDFVKSHADLVKGYDFALYLLSMDDAVVSSLMMKSKQTPFIPDENTSPKKYIIDCGNMPATPTKSWCDIVLADLNSDHLKRDQNTPNKLIRIV